MDQTSRLSSSLSLLARRVGEVAGEVERAMTAPLTLGPAASRKRWISTGTGASEGPARLFATLLRGDGIVADFAPISSFAPSQKNSAPVADVCVVVSQGLCPNARVPLARASEYAEMILVTTVDESIPNVRVIKHGPAEESGLLLRVVGPAAANATVIKLVQNQRSDPRLLRNLAATLPSIQATLLFDGVGLVALGTDVALCDGLRHKMLEGLGLALPMWDLCDLVHGPLQSFYERDATLILFEREDDDDARELTARLERVLHPARHRIVRLTSSLPGPLALLDFDLQLDHLLLAALRARPRDLVDWPGKGHDSALYELGKPPSI